jgi:hypothetical protein
MDPPVGSSRKSGSSGLLMERAQEGHLHRRHLHPSRCRGWRICAGTRRWRGTTEQNDAAQEAK